MPRLGRRRGRAIQTIGTLSAVGISFVLAILIGAGVGYVLDDWLGTTPWLFLLFFFLGVAAGMLNVFRSASRFVRERDRTGSDASAN